MNVLLILFLFIIIKEMKFPEQGSFYTDYCSARKTNAIKGMYVFLLFFWHSPDYFELGDADRMVSTVAETFKQLPVAPVLFYSGYGIMESIKKKGLNYIKSIPIQRVLKTILLGDAAVIVFTLVYLLLGFDVSFKQFALSLIFWDFIGNNTWYSFIIISLYLLTYASFRIFHKNHFLSAVMLVVFSLPVFFILSHTRDVFWFNTYFVYHFGVFFSLLREPVEKIVMKNNITYCAAMSAALLGFAYFFRMGSYYYFIVASCMFMAFFVGITMKVSVDSVFFQFLGKHLFAFYAFHRLPLIFTYFFNTSNFVKVLFAFIATCGIACAFDYYSAWLDRAFFKKSLRKSTKV